MSRSWSWFEAGFDFDFETPQWSWNGNFCWDWNWERPTAEKKLSCRPLSKLFELYRFGRHGVIADIWFKPARACCYIDTLGLRSTVMRPIKHSYRKLYQYHPRNNPDQNYLWHWHAYTLLYWVDTSGQLFTGMIYHSYCYSRLRLHWFLMLSSCVDCCCYHVVSLLLLYTSLKTSSYVLLIAVEWLLRLFTEQIAICRTNPAIYQV